jgi:salicylate hydroxylase
MLPHLGAGVGQGFEDVFALCALLGDARTRAHNLDVNLASWILTSGLTVSPD